MILDFEKYAQKGNEFMNELERNLGTDDRAQAGRLVRSTFRVLRNHLTTKESFQLLSQLPMALKSVYVDGWAPGSHNKVKTADAFLAEIIEEDGSSAWSDFSNRDEIVEAVRAVIITLKNYVSAGEMDQAIGTLPKKVQQIFRTPSKEEV